MFEAIIKNLVECTYFGENYLLYSKFILPGEYLFEFAEDPNVRLMYPWAKQDNIAPIVVLCGTMLGMPAWLFRELIRKGQITLSRKLVN